MGRWVSDMQNTQFLLFRPNEWRTKGMQKSSIFCEMNLFVKYFYRPEKLVKLSKLFLKFKIVKILLKQNCSKLQCFQNFQNYQKSKNGSKSQPFKKKKRKEKKKEKEKKRKKGKKEKLSKIAKLPKNLKWTKIYVQNGSKYLRLTEKNL